MKKDDSLLVDKGTKLKIISTPTYNVQVLNPNAGQHGQSKYRYLNRGDIITVTRKANVGRSVHFYFEEANNANSYVTLSNVDFEYSQGSNEKGIMRAMEIISKQIEALYDKQTILKNKLAYLEETKKTKIDDSDFKAWLMLKTLRDNKDAPDNKKIALISKLMKTSMP